MSLAPPLYLPFLNNPAVVSIGAKSLLADRWIEPDEYFSDYIDNKKRLFALDPQRVFAELPESRAAQIELSARLTAHLLSNTNYPQSLSETIASNPAGNIWELGLYVQDDLCLLEESQGSYRLTAASLCAPSEWSLNEKIGKPIQEIHHPVPGLNKKIGSQIEHMMAKLSPLRPMERFNWSLKHDPRLALFPDRAPLKSQKNLYIRVERQTLVRLPKTQAIAFTIRVYIYPIEQLVAVPGALLSLKQAVDNMSAEEVSYKSLAPLYPQFQRFCKQHSI